MKSLGRVVIVVVVLVLCVAAATPVFAQKNNAGNQGAAYLPPDGTVVLDYVNGTGGTTPNAWFFTRLYAGRSYTIQVVNASGASTGAGGNSSQVTVGLFFDTITGTTATTTDISTMSPAENGPGGGYLYNSTTGGHRYTLTPTVSQSLLILVNDEFAPPAAAQTWFQISVQETTLTAPWYFTDANFEGFTQVENTSSANVTFVLTHYSFVASSGGTTSPVGSVITFVLPPFGTTFVSAKGGAGVPAGSSGSLKITHNGPPGAIRANVTTVNATGLGLTHSFNMAFTGLERGGVR